MNGGAALQGVLLLGVAGLGVLFLVRGYFGPLVDGITAQIGGAPKAPIVVPTPAARGSQDNVTAGASALAQATADIAARIQTIEGK